MRDALPLLMPVAVLFVIGVVVRVAPLQEVKRHKHPTPPHE